MDQKKALPLLPRRFYQWQVIYLCLTGAFCFWFSRQSLLDHAITNYWFDSVHQVFPLKNSYWLETINHKLLKYIVIIIAFGLLVTGIIKRRIDFITAAIMIGLGSAVVGILKSISQHACPWDLVAYGGKALEYPLLNTVNYFDKPGHCFPAGHASGGFSLMALFFLFYPKNRKLALIALASAFALGHIMGFGQVVRGAHFLSHNLWSCWWVWLTQVTLYGLLSSYLPHSCQQKWINWHAFNAKKRSVKT